MKTVQITRTISGGAGMAAYRQHLGLQAAGVDSSVLVTSRKDHGDGVHVMRPSGALARLRRNADKWRRGMEMRRYRHTVLPTLEIFTDDRMLGGDVISDELPSADVYNLHWISQTIDIGRFSTKLERYQPLTWTLHDMNAFTGGCHYSLGCEKFMSGCGSCPQLGSHDDQDISARVFRRKQAAMERLSVETTCIIGPSRWMQELAQRSPLLDRFESVFLPNGIDCDVFRPQPRAQARKELGLPAKGAIVLFVADSVSNHRKGFDQFQAAVRGLDIGSPITLISVGSGTAPEFECVHPHISLGRISSPERLALVFAASDVFVTPVRAENLGTVVLEAMACGTAVVGFDVGGIPDMVRDGETGLLAPQEDIAALRQAIEKILMDGGMRDRMGQAGRQLAVAEFELTKQAERLMALYQRLIETSQRLRREA